MTEGELILNESHTILKYLHLSRNCGDHWYPKDVKKRAIIDQGLDWHHTHLRWDVYQKLQRVFLMPLLNLKPKRGELKKYSKILHQSLKSLNSILEGQKYYCGDEIAIVDLSLSAEINSLWSITKNLSRYPNIQEWMERLKEIPEIKHTFEKVEEQFFKSNKISSKILAKI
mmetsp:Transcript_16520/g.14421  ORF Transcript_16520/g.14421 Transcript_16520/m.14421 type:complete len:171 (+) Transcript_16520:201-713(+)